MNKERILEEFAKQLDYWVDESVKAATDSNSNLAWSENEDDFRKIQELTHSGQLNASSVRRLNLDRTSQTNSVGRANLFENVAGYGFSTFAPPLDSRQIKLIGLATSNSLPSGSWDSPRCHFTGKDRLHSTPQRHARLRALSRSTTGNPVSCHGGFPVKIR